MLAALGRERWGQSARERAKEPQKGADVVTSLIGEGVKHWQEDQAFASSFQDLDTELI